MTSRTSLPQIAFTTIVLIGIAQMGYGQTATMIPCASTVVDMDYYNKNAGFQDGQVVKSNVESCCEDCCFGEATNVSLEALVNRNKEKKRLRRQNWNGQRASNPQNNKLLAFAGEGIKKSK